MSHGTQGDRVLFWREDPIEVEQMQEGESENVFHLTWHFGTTYMADSCQAGEEGGGSEEESRGRRRRKEEGLVGVVEWWEADGDKVVICRCI